MGRRKNNATVDQDVKSFTETKEDSLKVFESSNVSITQEVIDMYEVKPVGSPAKLGGHNIEAFCGKNYKESLKLAYEWRDRYNSSQDEFRISFVNYYPQEFRKRAILIGYNKLENSKG